MTCSSVERRGHGGGDFIDSGTQSRVQRRCRQADLDLADAGLAEFTTVVESPAAAPAGH